MRIEETPDLKHKGKKIYTIELELDSYGIKFDKKIIQLSIEGIEKEYDKKPLKARPAFLNELFGEINISQIKLLEQVLEDYHDLLDDIPGECETKIDEVENKFSQHCSKILNHILYLQGRKEKSETTENKLLLWRGNIESLIELYSQLAKRGWIKRDINRSESMRKRKYSDIDWVLIANHFALKKNNEIIKLDPVVLAKKFKSEQALEKNKISFDGKTPIQEIEWLIDQSVLIDLFVQLTTTEHEFIESPMEFEETKDSKDAGLKNKKKIFTSKNTPWSMLVDHFVVSDKSNHLKRLVDSKLGNNFGRMKKNSSGRSKESDTINYIIKALGPPPPIRSKENVDDFDEQRELPRNHGPLIPRKK